MKMKIGIVAGGPKQALADLKLYLDEIDIWIGADTGAYYLLEAHLPIDCAVGDFDSVDASTRSRIEKNATIFKQYPKEKNETDLELAVEAAISYKPVSIILFGVTAGRLDHELANIQLLYYLLNQGFQATIVDRKNKLTMYSPGEYIVKAKNDELISFIPFSSEVNGLTLKDFYYPLENKTVQWGSTRCISNQLMKQEGTFSFTQGILIMIKTTEKDNYN